MAEGSSERDTLGEVAVPEGVYYGPQTQRARENFPVSGRGIPAALVHPKTPYLEGLALFALLCVFLWGEQVRRNRVVVAILVCAAAGGAAIVLAPGLRADRPWLDYEGLANRLDANASAASFDWTQSYATVPANYAMRYVACGNASRQMTYDVRWNVVRMTTNNRAVVISARPVESTTVGGLKYVVPVNLRTVDGTP